MKRPEIEAVGFRSGPEVRLDRRTKAVHSPHPPLPFEGPAAPAVLEALLRSPAFESYALSDASLRMISAGRAFEEMTGWSVEESAEGFPGFSGSPAGDLPPAVAAALDRLGVWEGAVECVRPGGAKAWIDWTVRRAEAGGQSLLVLSVRDAAFDHARRRRRLAADRKDALTGLPDKTVLLEACAEALVRAKSSGSITALLSVDLDRFRWINDAHGQDAGDDVLRIVADRIQACPRQDDLVARIGGDCFAVLMEDVQGPEAPSSVAERISRAIQERTVVAGRNLRLAASIGIAFFPKDGSDAASVMSAAYSAMRTAKSAGRGSVRFYDPVLAEEAAERMRMELDLAEAIRSGGLELHVQPKIDLSTGWVSGVEALARWLHPVRGQIPPMVFVPLAEEAGLIGELGDWVVEEACRMAVDWRLAGAFAPIAINVSALQLDGPGFAERLVAIVSSHGLPPSAIDVEITESAVMGDPTAAIEMIRSLRARGFKVAIDDFGTGYSSLSQLRSLTVDTIKIDRSFILEADSDPQAEGIVRAILELGRVLGLGVVAEGVETKEHADLLARLGCPSAQGYLYAKPMPSADFPAWESKRTAAA